jgi:hypothetical protein
LYACCKKQSHFFKDLLFTPLNVLHHSSTFLGLLAMLWLGGCSSDKQSTSTTDKPSAVSVSKLPNIDLDIQRLEISCLAMAKQIDQAGPQPSIEQMQAAYAQHLQAHSPFIGSWLLGVAPSYFDTMDRKLLDKSLATDLGAFYQDKRTRVPIDSALHYFPPKYDLKGLLQEPFQRLKYHLPDFQIPKVRTWAWGYTREQPWEVQFSNNQIYYAESYLGIGLDFFCDSAYKILPPDAPRYVRKFFKPEQIPVAALSKVAESLIKVNSKANKTPKLIELMVQEGIKYYLLDLALPETPDDVKFQCSPVQLKNAQKMTPDIYRMLVPLLYSEKFFDYEWAVLPGPKCNRFEQDVPARVAYYIGWQIVRSYMAKNPSIKLESLLKQKDYEAILKGAQFKP